VSIPEPLVRQVTVIVFVVVLVEGGAREAFVTVLAAGVTVLVLLTKKISFWIKELSKLITVISNDLEEASLKSNLW